MVEQEQVVESFPVFAYDPEKPIEPDPYTEELNEKLAVIIEADPSLFNIKKEEQERSRILADFERTFEPTKTQGNPIIEDLFHIINDVKTDIRRMHTPEFSGRAVDDRATRVAIRHFLRGRKGLAAGVGIYAMRIEQCLYALLKYARYHKDQFGVNNSNLHIALQRYDLLKEQMDKTKVNMKKAEYLHSMILAAEILFEKQLEQVTPEEISPIVSEDVSMGSDEFGMESEN